MSKTNVPSLLLSTEVSRQAYIELGDSWTLTAGLEKRIQAFETIAIGVCLVYETENINRTNTYRSRSLSLLDIRNLYCQPLGVASYHDSAMSTVMTLCQESYYRKQWLVVVAEEDRVNHGKTLRNEQASHCRCCCASQTTDRDGLPLQRRRLSDRVPPKTLGCHGC